MNIQTDKLLRDLHQTLIDDKTRFSSEFIMQDVRLKDIFKETYQNYLQTRSCSAEYFDYTTVITNSFGQNIVIANQWFVMASYFVNFCTEMLTYRHLFENICKRMGMLIKDMKDYSEHLRTAPTEYDRSKFLSYAIAYLKENYSQSQDDFNKVASYLWRFVTDYSWWSGSKTINRHDFFVSPLLNQINVVNANSEFLAFIVKAYASILSLRVLVDSVSDFIIEARSPHNQSSFLVEPPSEYNTLGVCEPPVVLSSGNLKRISISAASFERFKSGM